MSEEESRQVGEQKQKVQPHGLSFVANSTLLQSRFTHTHVFLTMCVTLLYQYFCLLFAFCLFVESGFPSVALAVLELAL